MASNRLYAEANRTFHDKFVAGQHRTNGVPLKGDAVILGQLPGVALTDVDAAGEVTAQLDGVFNLYVKGVTTGGGNAAIKGGDAIYLKESDTHTQSLSGNATGSVFFGYAIGDHNASVVTSGAIGLIPVKVGR